MTLLKGPLTPPLYHWHSSEHRLQGDLGCLLIASLWECTLNDFLHLRIVGKILYTLKLMEERFILRLEDSVYRGGSKAGRERQRGLVEESCSHHGGQEAKTEGAGGRESTAGHTTVTCLSLHHC